MSLSRTSTIHGILFSTFFATSYSSAISHEIKVAVSSVGKVIGIINISSNEGCFVPKKELGRVTKLDFDHRGYISFITIKKLNGALSSFNVDSEYSSGPRLKAENIKKSLESISAIGNNVEVISYRCGAAGRVVIAHSILLKI